MTPTDRAHVTLDRRESNDRRLNQQRGDGDRRAADRRSGSDRRTQTAAIDFSDRRADARREAQDRRIGERRSEERRQSLRRADTLEDLGISLEEFDSLDPILKSRLQPLSQVLLVLGLIWLLSALSS